MPLHTAREGRCPDRHSLRKRLHHKLRSPPSLPPSRHHILLTTPSSFGVPTRFNRDRAYAAVTASWASVALNLCGSCTLLWALFGLGW